MYLKRFVVSFSRLYGVLGLYCTFGDSPCSNEFKLCGFGIVCLRYIWVYYYVFRLRGYAQVSVGPQRTYIDVIAHFTAHVPASAAGAHRSHFESPGPPTLEAPQLLCLRPPDRMSSPTVQLLLR